MKYSREICLSYLMAMLLSLSVVPLTYSGDKKTSAKQTTAKTDQGKKYAWPTTAPAGPLNSGWYQSYGSVAYHFAKHWTGRAHWDYYGYHED